MKIFKNKIINLNNLYFIIIFFLARFLPFIVFFYGAHILNPNQYVELENLIAIATFFTGFVSLGTSGVVTVITQSSTNLNLIHRHTQIASLLLFLLSTIFFLLNYYFILNILNLLIILLITNSLRDYLKINSKKIYGLLSECFFYFLILLFFTFMILNNLVNDYKNFLNYFFYISSFLYIATHFIFYGQKIFINFSRNDLKRVYSRSYGLLISGIILTFLSLYPRLFIKFFPEHQQFEFLFTYRIIFLGMIVHQIFSTFFFRNIFKSNWIIVLKLTIIIVTLTLFGSIMIVSIYILIDHYFFSNLENISFNFLMITQIFLLSFINYVNIFMLRSKKSIYFFNKFMLIVFLFSVVTFLIFKFNNLDIAYLSIFHIIVMILYLFFSCKYLIKFILPKKIKII